MCDCTNFKKGSTQCLGWPFGTTIGIMLVSTLGLILLQKLGAYR